MVKICLIYVRWVSAAGVREGREMGGRFTAKGERGANTAQSAGGAGSEDGEGCEGIVWVGRWVAGLEL